jgi:hypothetical protein
LKAFISPDPSQFSAEPDKWMEYRFIEKLGRDLKQPEMFEEEHPYQICNNLFNIGPNKVKFEDHRDVWFINGLPYWVMNGKLRKGATLHCWGRAKTRIPEIVKQSRESHLEPKRLTLP